MKKPLIKIGIILLIIFVIIIFAIVSPWLFIWGGINFLTPTPPKPAITYGEFPFRLEYEMNGQIFEVEDTLICKFDGFGANEANGKYRKWKSHLASGNARITLLKNDDIEIFFTPGLNTWSIAASYMGDNEIYHTNINSTFPAAYSKHPDAPLRNAYVISASDMWEKYHIRLLKWEPSQPIQNSFK